MEVPEKFKSKLVGFRYLLSALAFMTTLTLLVACGGSEDSKKTVIAPGGGVGTPDDEISQIIITIRDTSINVGGFNTVVRADVFNFNGEPVLDGTTVSFNVMPIGTIPATGETENGSVSVSLVSSDTVGEYSLVVTAGDASSVAFGEFTPLKASAANTSLSANPTAIPADETSTSLITLIARDAYNNPVEDGTTVTFYTTEGSLSGATTTANGVATVEFLSAADSGIATITAEVDGVIKTTTVNMGGVIVGGSGTASYIEITGGPSAIGVQGAGGQQSASITARAYDDSGSPISDCDGNIEFSIVGGPNGGEQLDGEDATPTAPLSKTTENGVSTVVLTSGFVSGTVRVQAEVVENFDCSVSGSYAIGYSTSIAIEAGEPTNIVIFKDTTLVDNNDGSISMTISALAQDLHGNMVENGTAISFGLIDNPTPNPDYDDPINTPNEPKYLGFLSGGADGETSGNFKFSSATADFDADGVIDDDILIILEGRDMGGHRIETVDTGLSPFEHTLYDRLNGSETGLSFIAGYAQLGAICGTAQTGNQEMDSTCTATEVGGAGSVKGVAHTVLTWPGPAIFKPFNIYAESKGGDVGNTLPADSYSAVAPLDITMQIVPSTVVAPASNIYVDALFIDNGGHRIQGEDVVFYSGDTSKANFGGSASDYSTTGSAGRAAVTSLDVLGGCAPGDTVIITASLSGFTQQATLTCK